VRGRKEGKKERRKGRRRILSWGKKKNITMEYHGSFDTILFIPLPPCNSVSSVVKILPLLLIE